MNDKNVLQNRLCRQIQADYGLMREQNVLAKIMTVTAITINVKTVAKNGKYAMRSSLRNKNLIEQDRQLSEPTVPGGGKFGGNIIEDIEDFSDFDEVEPTIDTEPKQVQEAPLEERFYTKALRGPRDVVLSGPVIGGWGGGRYFQNKRLAYRWLTLKYGPERVIWPEKGQRGRWAFVIKNFRVA